MQPKDFKKPLVTSIPPPTNADTPVLQSRDITQNQTPPTHRHPARPQPTQPKTWVTTNSMATPPYTDLIRSPQEDGPQPKVASLPAAPPPFFFLLITYVTPCTLCTQPNHDHSCTTPKGPTLTQIRIVHTLGSTPTTYPPPCKCLTRG
jgi:hypothetical protein